MKRSKQNFSKAHYAVRSAIRRGELLRPSTLRCVDCHARACAYDHAKGYAPKYWLDVEEVCHRCHILRAVARGEIKRCMKHPNGPRVRQRSRGICETFCVLCNRERAMRYYYTHPKRDRRAYLREYYLRGKLK